MAPQPPLARMLARIRDWIDLLDGPCDGHAAGEAVRAFARGDAARASALLAGIRDAIAAGECACDDARLVRHLDVAIARLGAAERVAA